MNYSYGKAQKVMYLGIDGFDPLYAQRLLKEGRLPNIAAFLKRGVTTKDNGMIGAMPSYTPPNWCSMATGAWPGTHGITCYWNHQLGDPLDRMFIGFDSTKVKAEFIQDTFSKNGKKSIVIGWPTTWPATNDKSIVVDGGGIHPFLTDSIDFERFYYCSESTKELSFVSHKSNENAADCFVTETVEDLTFGIDMEDVTAGDTDTMLSEVNSGSGHDGSTDREYCPITVAKDWGWDVGNAKEAVILVNNGLERRYVLILSGADGKYDHIEVYKNKKDSTSKLTQIKEVGTWSDYVYDYVMFDNASTKVGYRFKLVALSANGDEMTLYSTFSCNLDSVGPVQPAGLKQELIEALGGPELMSNCGRTDLEEIKIVYEANARAFRWTMDMIDYLLENKEWDLALHGIHIIDISTHVHLNTISAGTEYEQLHYDYIDKYYELADEYVGRNLKWLDRGVSIALGSDHGGILMGDNSIELGDAWELNIGVLEELGYTVTKNINGKKVIDWSKTRAIAQRSSYIYVNLKGRDPQGIVDPDDYDELLDQIIDDLYAYRDPKTGKRVVSMALKREDMELVHLYGESDRVGDIFYVLETYFAHDQGNSLPTGNREGTSLRCFFALAGEGIKKDCVLERRVEIVDIVPTLCHLAGVPVPKTVDGGVIYQGLLDD